MTQTLEERNKLRRERYAKNRLDPEYMSRRREYERNRYKNNPLTPKQKKAKYEWTKKHRKENPDYRTNLYSRLSQDPEWVKRSRAYQKEYALKRKDDPKWIENRRKSRIKSTKKRNDRKQYIINLLGGCCIVCGYDKCNRAIDLHETEKRFDLNPAKHISSNTGFQLLLDNIDILIPLCKTCHMEYHAGLIQLPEKSAPI